MTRRGENDFHGNFWEFLRNDIFNANAFFRNATGQPKPNLKQNQFGATLGGPDQKEQVVLLRLLPGDAAGERPGPDLGGEPDPAAAGQRPLRRDAGGAVLPGQSPTERAASPTRYLTFAGGKQLDCLNRNTATTAPHQPGRAAHAAGQGGRRLLSDPLAADADHLRRQRGPGLLVLQPAVHLQREPLSSPTSITVSAQEHALRARVHCHGGPVEVVRLARRIPGRAGRSGLGRPAGADATDVATSLKLTSTLTANVVNEATMAFTRNNTDAVGVGTPSAASFGMTAGRPALSAAAGNHGARVRWAPSASSAPTPTTTTFATVTYSWADNLSWVRGKQRIRDGRVVSDAVQRPRRHRRRARQDHLPDVRRFPARPERGRTI